MSNLEILAPGGGFNSSIHAFEAGADAVYIGMSSFSARKGAKNFTLEQLRRLKAYAVEFNKKIFVAINTILKEEEMPEVIRMLHHLSLINIDGIILQDTGLAYIIKTYFPEIEIHASTQMAVHNSQGVAFLKRYGFSRIILARELTLQEIKHIRNEHKDVELEVFIHGAMCFSFSGICLASGMILGRSGNRGACGQICRTWFESEQGNTYQFSANDLKAGTLVKQLKEIGIDSLKIEGRLKSPEYVSHTVSYYRFLIDGKNEKKVDEEEELSALSFSRDQTTAFLSNHKGDNMVNNRFASHTGIPAGRVVSVGHKSFTMKCLTDLSDRDGLLIPDDQGSQQFAMKSDGKKSHYIKGDNVTVFHSGKVKQGAEVHKISGHNLQLKEFNENSRKPWKTPLTIHVELNKNSLSISSSLFNEKLTREEDVRIEVSRSGKPINEILTQIFSKSGTSLFTLKEIQVKNRTEYEDNGIFIPLPVLKKIKSDFFDYVEKELREILTEKSDAIYNFIKEKAAEGQYVRVPEIEVPLRQEMTSKGSMIPFSRDFQPDENKNHFIPLPPLLFNEQDFKRLEEQIETLSQDITQNVLIGINNISHFHFVEKYEQKENISFFTDYCTYIANSASLLFYREQIRKLEFSYYWIEDKEGSLHDMKKIEKDFKPHLFVSRICYRKHNGLGSCNNCGKRFTYDLKQQNNSFQVEVQDCITWLFQKG
jgi:putative protease